MKFFAVILLLLIPVSLFAEDVGFMGMHIGMSREKVIAAAEAQPVLTVPRNRDVDFFPIEEREIMTFSARPEVPFIYLQFYDDILFSITVIFDEHLVDYFTLARRLEEKYGPYTSLEPGWRMWDRGDVTIKVEKPAVVKYIALERLIEAAGFDPNQTAVNPARDELLRGL